MNSLLNRVAKSRFLSAIDARIYRLAMMICQRNPASWERSYYNLNSILCQAPNFHALKFNLGRSEDGAGSIDLIL